MTRELKNTASGTEIQKLQTADDGDNWSGELVEICNVTVKFQITETQVIAQVYPNQMSLGDVKSDIARKFEVDPNILLISQCGKVLNDKCLIMETDQNEFNIHEYELGLKIKPQESGDALPRLDLNVYFTKHRLPEMITVHVSAEDSMDGLEKNLLVEIQNDAIIKPFLCGFLDKKTGVEYLDAFTQTGPYFDKWKQRRYYSRDTQTRWWKEKLIDTAHDQTAECWMDGNNVRYVTAATDFEIVPGKYQNHMQKMRLENKLAKIRLIQRNWRRFLAVRYMREAAAKYRTLVANREAEEERFRLESEKTIAQTEHAKQFPKTKADFDLVYSEIQKWKMAEMKRISQLYDGAARVAEVNIILDKEIQLLAATDRQRRIVMKANEDFREEQLLKKMGEPIKWIGYKDNTIHLDLLRTQRVRFLHEVYKDLREPREKEDRIELLMKVREIILNEREFPGFPELFDLFDREKNLLIYTNNCDVEVLRKRQNLLFVDLIKYSKDHLPEKISKRMCMVCKKIKPLKKFDIRTRQSKIDTCAKCRALTIQSSEQIVYSAMLRSIQRDERRKKANSSFAFIMQIDDLRYLVENIWHSHSILSKSTDLNFLRMPRWIKSDDWAPWNCVCLTVQEARDHYVLENLNDIYDRKVMLEIRNHHMLALNAFRKLAAAATELLETGNWFKVGMNKQRTAEMSSKFPDEEVFDEEEEKKVYCEDLEEAQRLLEESMSDSRC